ncbi:AraC family transcriptional regulator [Chitinophaga sedimenti]|uniref:AraC family transcriptional regulator n=1 Tax=Chitinophaga sedimenti TaxID=2033606 RepID=UPI0020034C01|nr:AraC family transcriptional regulator [Chitinophaga sedimenti]MCK7559446.1 AraC family transcriptional regulator [Chitinophaga sedimenti]
MALHLVSKKAGPVQVENVWPEKVKQFLINDAEVQLTSWNGNLLLMQEKTSGPYGIHFIDIFTEQVDELVSIYEKPIILLHISLEGTLEFRLEGRKDPVVLHERGLMVTLVPNLSATATMKPGRHRSLALCIGAELFWEMVAQIPGLDQALVRKRPGDLFSLTRHPKIANSQIIELCRYIGNARDGRDVLSLCHQLVKGVLTLLSTPAQAIGLSQDKIDKVYLAKQCIINNLKECYSLQSIAENAQISARQLRSWFPAVFSMTTMQFVMEVRMRRAGELLLQEPRLTEDAIAEMIGYTDNGGMRKAFKAHYQMLPSEFITKCPKYFVK